MPCKKPVTSLLFRRTENHFSCFPDEKHMEIQEMPLLIPLSCLALNLTARYKYKALNLWGFSNAIPFQHQLDVCI